MYLNLGVDSTFLIIKFIVVIGVHLQVVESEFLLDSLLEGLALLEGQRVGLGDNRDDIDDVGQLLQDNNVNGFQTKALVNIVQIIKGYRGESYA